MFLNTWKNKRNKFSAFACQHDAAMIAAAICKDVATFGHGKMSVEARRQRRRHSVIAKKSQILFVFLS